MYHLPQTIFLGKQIGVTVPLPHTLTRLDNSDSMLFNNIVTFIEVTLPVCLDYTDILMKTGHISNMTDGGIMCNNRNISLTVYNICNPNARINVYVLLCIRT